MSDTSEILKNAASRAQELTLPYAGALTPLEAFDLMKAGAAKLVDVRTRAEWDYVGKIPGALLIEWQAYPSSLLNPEFLNQLRAEVSKEQTVMFICRSGARSNSAAKRATEAGYTRSYNILQGFEGDKDAEGHRNSAGGWRFAGLPWTQG